MNVSFRKIAIKRWQLCCLLFFTIACEHKTGYNNFKLTVADSVELEKNAIAAIDSIQLYKKMVKSGDIILRTGKDFTSETMRQLSLHDKTYSHCGIASIENDSVFVYHAIGGEWNPNQKLRRDPFELFCNPYENRGFGIFRYKFTTQENKNLIDTIHRLYHEQIKFDMQFDLSTDDRMYCSEFIYKSITRATAHQIRIPVTVINGIRFIAPDDLYLNSSCSQIKRVAFRRP